MSLKHNIRGKAAKEREGQREPQEGGLLGGAPSCRPPDGRRSPPPEGGPLPLGRADSPSHGRREGGGLGPVWYGISGIRGGRVTIRSDGVSYVKRNICACTSVSVRPMERNPGSGQSWAAAFHGWNRVDPHGFTHASNPGQKENSHLLRARPWIRNSVASSRGRNRFLRQMVI